MTKLRRSAIGNEPLEPFSDGALPCRKCFGFGTIVCYSTQSSYGRDREGKLIGFSRKDTTPDSLAEHLVVRCGICGWEWLMRTKEQEEEGI